MTYDPTRLRMFVDGQEVDLSPLTGDGPISVTAGTLPLLWADFNARATLDHVWLDTAGSERSIARLGIPHAQLIGARVIISDGEVAAIARVVESTSSGRLMAEVEWGTLVKFDDPPVATPRGDRRGG